ncbi:MAG TPA: winged helix-turn-helix domain-containing protein [Pyrinomonadaceae bacterium]|nr:winged helix-turn-helix domain-containing protein [Pyrinomonadaceae bacterium]
MNGEPQTNISFAEFDLDMAHRTLRREGKPISINAKTFDLLLFLLENNGRIVSKEEILDTVWAGQFVEEANLSVQISALRKALGEKKDAPRFLVTIPGTGYKFVADVHRQDEEIVSEKPEIEPVALDEETEELQNIPPKQFTAGRSKHQKAVFAVAGLGLLILLGFFGYRYFADSSKNQIKSLAVLPFINQNNEANTEYLSEGLAESVIYSLSGFPELRVMSRNSAFRFSANEADARAIGKELNVEAVLTGRIVQVGENLSVSAELVSAEDNSVIWGEQFTRKMSDMEKLQTDIAQAISDKLRLKLSGADEKRLVENWTENAEAYRLYLLGRYHLNKLTDEGFRKGREYFEQAIEKDSGYAPAYAGLAEAYNRLSGYNAMPPNEGFPKARQAAEKALELDDQLAEAHATLGAIKHFYDWNSRAPKKNSNAPCR